MKVKDAHPKRKDRLNAVNNALGPAKPIKPGDKPKAPDPFLLYVVADECEPLVRDFAECGMQEFLNGHFSSTDLGHASDGLGYMIDYEHPATKKFEFYTKV